MWLSDISIRRPVFITMVVLALSVVGALTYARMPVNLFPDIAIPVIAVRTIYPGATPQDQARYLTLFRADSIVRDAELIREFRREVESDAHATVVVDYRTGTVHRSSDRGESFSFQPRIPSALEPTASSPHFEPGHTS